MDDTTTIQIYREDITRLDKLALARRETYKEIIKRLLDNFSKYDTESEDSEAAE